MSDDHGDAATSFTAANGTGYLIRVSERLGSGSNTFSLNVSAPIAPAHPPGKALRRRGVTRTLDRFRNPDDAWAVHLQVGVSYRIHLSGRDGHCDTPAPPLRAGHDELRRRDGRDPDAVRAGTGCSRPAPVRVALHSGVIRPATCAAPSPTTSRWPQRGPTTRRPASCCTTATASGGRCAGPTGLMARPVSIRDHPPQRRLPAPVGGRLRPRAADDHGRIISRRDRTIRTQTRPGRYYVAVRANFNQSGRYALSLTTRLITHTHTSLTGGLGWAAREPRRPRPARRGCSRSRSSASTRSRAGCSRGAVHVHGSGSVSATYDPPGPGLYRARSTFLGSRDAAASHSGYTTLEIGG